MSQFEYVFYYMQREREKAIWRYIQAMNFCFALSAILSSIQLLHDMNLATYSSLHVMKTYSYRFSIILFTTLQIEKHSTTIWIIIYTTNQLKANSRKSLKQQKSNMFQRKEVGKHQSCRFGYFLLKYCHVCFLM